MIQDLMLVADGTWSLGPHARWLFVIIPVMGLLIYSLYRKERELESRGRRNLADRTSIGGLDHFGDPSFRAPQSHHHY